MRCGFGIPQKVGQAHWVTEQDGEAEDDDVILSEDVLSLQDCERILHPLKEAVDAIEEIQTLYPPVARLDVAMLCDPWLGATTLEGDFEKAGLSYSILGFQKKCDFSTHKGYRAAVEHLDQLQPRWVVCNVPRGPASSRTTAAMEEKEISKIRKYQRVIRHLLLLSRHAMEHGQEVVWLTHPLSQVWRLPEVMAFWKANAHGPLAIGNEAVKVTSTSAATQNTFSTTTAGDFLGHETALDQDHTASQNTFSTTTWGALQSIWTWLTRSVTRRHGDLMWADDGEIYPIDTSVLETLEPPKLQRLMEDVRKLHRRFGHPSNKLLVKNLQSRNADPLVIAAASQLECDECLEGRIKMPSPAVNLERTDRLWSCLQVDGWDMKFDGRLHHFVLLVDEASGYTSKEHQNSGVHAVLARRFGLLSSISTSSRSSGKQHVGLPSSSNGKVVWSSPSFSLRDQGGWGITETIGYVVGDCSWSFEEVSWFHASQVRHASESERLLSSAATAPTFPWTFSSLTSLLTKGSYDDESRPKRRTWGRSSRVKAKAREAKEATGRTHVKAEQSAIPQHVRDAPSDEEMVPDIEERSKRPLPPEVESEDELNIDRLLDDVTYMPPGQPGPVSFREQRASHEQSDRPWHVQRGAASMYLEEDLSNTLFSVTLEIPDDPKAWKKILKDPSKFMVKNVQKGVEVSYHKLSDKQKTAMNAAKSAEIESWLGHKVAGPSCMSFHHRRAVREDEVALHLQGCRRWTFRKGEGQGQSQNSGAGVFRSLFVGEDHSKPGDVQIEQDAAVEHGHSQEMEDPRRGRQDGFPSGKTT